jgi:hypothetical protein
VCQRNFIRLKKQRTDTGSSRKRKKAVVEKVHCDREFMTGTIKAGNMNKKTHCDLNKMRDKEDNSM